MKGYRFEAQMYDGGDIVHAMLIPQVHVYFPELGIVAYRTSDISKGIDFCDINWDNHERDFESFENGKSFEINGEEVKFLGEIDISDEIVANYFSDRRLEEEREKELSDRISRLRREFNEGVDFDKIREVERNFFNSFLSSSQKSVYEMRSWYDSNRRHWVDGDWDRERISEEEVKQKLFEIYENIPEDEDRREFYLSLESEFGRVFFRSNNLPYKDSRNFTEEEIEFNGKGSFQKAVELTHYCFPIAGVTLPLVGFVVGGLLGSELFDNSYASNVSTGVSSLIGAITGLGMVILSYKPIDNYIERRREIKRCEIDKIKEKILEDREDNVINELEEMIEKYQE